MAEPIKTALTYLGYPQPLLVLERGAWLAGSMVCGNIAAKIFVPGLNIKSHFVFGQVSALTFNLIFHNQYAYDHILKETNPLKRDFYCFPPHFLAFTLIPLIFSKVIVSKWIEPLTFAQSFKRGLCYGGFGMLTLSVYALYQRDKKRRES